MLCTVPTNTECQWFRNNYNADGELYVGNVHSLEECIDLVQEHCVWANIAQIDENAAYGGMGDCWCQVGNNQTHDASIPYLGCWLGEIPVFDPPDNNTDCEWIRNDANRAGEIHVGNVNSLDECVELVQEMCPWATIANVHETVVNGSRGTCYCQNGNDQTYDASEEYLNCWLNGFVSNQSDMESTFPPDGIHCTAHDDCPSSSPFCFHSPIHSYFPFCTSCEYCHFCSNGVDSTCGSCGEGYPTHENVTNCIVDSNGDGSNETTSTPVGQQCYEHDDCPESRPFCYISGWDWGARNFGYCESCAECHHCADGVDNTCGSCGEGYPVHEDVEFCDGAMDQKVAPFLYVAPFVFAIVLALD